jgi:hypothetical protein
MSDDAALATSPRTTLIDDTPDEPAKVATEESMLTALDERQQLLANPVRSLAHRMSRICAWP